MAFNSNHFAILKGLEGSIFKSIQMRWILDLNSFNAKMEHLVYQLLDVFTNIFTIKRNFVIGDKTKMIIIGWEIIA